MRMWSSARIGEGRASLVIVLDANILLYVCDGSSRQHIKARSWVERVFSNSTMVGLPWQTVTAVLRIMTDPRLPGERLSGCARQSTSTRPQAHKFFVFIVAYWDWVGVYGPG